jgi:hypothetical protein
MFILISFIARIILTSKINRKLHLLYFEAIVLRILVWTIKPNRTMLRKLIIFIVYLLHFFIVYDREKYRLQMCHSIAL